MTSHIISAYFSSDPDPLSADIEMHELDSLGVTVRWMIGANPVNLTGAYVSANARHLDGSLTQIGAEVSSVSSGEVSVTASSGALKAGLYEVQARLTIGEETQTVQFRVIVQQSFGTLISPPVITGSLSAVSLVGGSESQAVDAGDVISGATAWAVSGGGATIDGNGIVTISADTVRDAETVTVSASNSAGTVSVTFALTVTATAPGVTSDGTLSAQDDGDTVTYTLTPPVVTGLPTPDVVPTATLGVDPIAIVSGQVIVSKTLAAQDLVVTWAVTNGTLPDASSTAAAVVPAATITATAPAAMDAPTLTATSTSTITATLAADPSDGGAAITSRSLIYTVNSGSAIEVTGLAAGDAYDIAGLAPGDEIVAFSVAINAVGTGPDGTASAPAATWSLPDTMLAPTLVGGVSAATLQWPAAPNLNGRPLVTNGYRYEVTTAADTGFASVVASGQQADLSDTDISPLSDDDYIARVWAVTDAGPGTPSPASAAASVSSGTGGVALSTDWLTITGATGALDATTFAQPGALMIQTSTGSVTISDVSIEKEDGSTTTVGGLNSNGIASNFVGKNLVFGDNQPFYPGGPSYSAAKQVTLPITAVPGDILTFSREKPTSGAIRDGIGDYVSVMITDTMPAGAANLAPAAVGWAGRGSPVLEAEVADFNVILSLMTAANIDTSGYENFAARQLTFEDCKSIIRYAPHFSTGTGSTGWGYQQSLPYNMGDGGSNYGDDLSVKISLVALWAFTNIGTDAQRLEIIAALCQWGKEIFDVKRGVLGVILNNGAHHNWHYIPLCFYLKATGQEAELENFGAGAYDLMGNAGQILKLDAPTIALLTTPHRDTSKPTASWIRRVDAINSPTEMVVELNPGVNNCNARGHAIQGVTADALDGRITRITGQTGAGDYVENGPLLTIQVEDTSAFSVDDEIIWYPPYDYQVGQFMWVIRSDSGYEKSWSGFVLDNYINLQAYNGATLVMGLLGLADATPFKNWIKFQQLVARQELTPAGAAYPAADWFYEPSSFRANPLIKDYWRDLSESALPLLVDGATTYTATPDEFNIDFKPHDDGLMKGFGYADSQVTGTSTAPDGAIVEAMFEAYQDGTDARVPAADTAWFESPPLSNGDGTWSATVRAPTSDFTSYRLVSRVKGSTAPAEVTTTRCWVGSLVDAWEQSNGSKLLESFALSDPNSDLYEAVTNDFNLMIAAKGGGTATYYTHVTQANVGLDVAGVSPATVRLQRILHAEAPGRKFAFTFQTQSGTSFHDAMTTPAEDAAFGTPGDRDWNTVLELDDYFHQNGAQTGVNTIPGWIESHVGDDPSIATNFLSACTGYTKDRASKIALSSFWGGGVPRIFAKVLYDGSTTDAEGVEHSGIYDNRYTVHLYFGPHGNIRSTVDGATFATIYDLPDYDNSANYVQGVSNAKTFWSPAIHPEVLAYPGETQGPARRDFGDGNGLHFDGRTVWGRQYLMSMWAYRLLSAMGLASITLPSFDVREDAPDGSYADFGLSGGRSVTTRRKVLTDAGTLVQPGPLPDITPFPLSGEPHNTHVAGMHIDKVPVERAELMSVTGHPVFADGQQFIRVYPRTGEPNNTYGNIVGYGHGNSPHILTFPDKTEMNSAMDAPVVDLGPNEYFDLAPIELQQDVYLPTTLPTPNFFATTDAKFVGADTTAMPNSSQAIFEFRGRIDSVAGTRFNIICGGNGKKPKVYIEADDTIVLAVGANSTAVPSRVGSLIHYRWIVDNDAGTVEIIDLIDGANSVAATPSGETGLFGDTGAVQMLGNTVLYDPLQATVEFVKVWLGTSGTPASIANPPSYAATAIAASPFVELTTDGGDTISDISPTPVTDGVA